MNASLDSRPPPQRIALVVGLAAALFGAASTQADNAWWPQFRGPNASGLGADAKPPIKPSTNALVRWKIEVPWSPSSPAIWNEHLFISTFHDDQLQTRAYERSTGRLLWAQGVKPERVEEFHRTDGSPAAATPATDGQHVVSYFGSFGLVCYDFTGKELWRAPLPVALSGGNYGSGTSPIIVGNKVLLDRDMDANSSVMALEVETGRKLWETPRPDMIGGFGTPIYWKNESTEELVVGGSLQVKGYDLSSGQERWVVNGVASFVCTTPVVGDGLLYFGAWSQGKADSGFPTDWTAFAAKYDKNGDGAVTAADFDPVTWQFMRGIDVDRNGSITAEDLDRIKSRSARAENALVAIRPGGKGEITSTHVAWKFTRGLPYVPSPLYYDGRIYYVKDGGMFTSVDAKTGKPYYVQERLGAPGSYYASPVAADGRIYLASVSGKLTVVRAGGESPEILHQADFGERILATPALVGDKLYLRTQDHLYSLGGTEAR